MLALLLAACHIFESPEIKFTCDEIPDCSEADADTDADADADADADTDTDTDTTPPDPESGLPDCNDGTDNDLDGLIDCEDDGCLDVCIEDCTDGTDNDQDAFTDCDDDECYGIEDCGGPYHLMMYTAFDQVAFATGSDLYQLGSSFNTNIALFSSGEVEVSGTPYGWDGGEDFTCVGLFQGGYDVSGYNDAFTYIGPLSDVDYAMGFQPSEATKTLTWNTDCPLTAMPYSILGFVVGKYSIFRDNAGTWSPQYYSEYYSVQTYTGYDLQITYLYDVGPYELVEWTGHY
ncbi:MAG: hypothetical protein ACI8RZ_002940 [Myxococcota bacterium]|jgi:hypothetical protein